MSGVIAADSLFMLEVPLSNASQLLQYQTVRDNKENERVSTVKRDSKEVKNLLCVQMVSYPQ